MNRLVMSAVVGTAVLGLTACGGHSGGGATSSGNSQTPAQQIAAELVGTQDSTTGATVSSATVSASSVLVCKASFGEACVPNNTAAVATPYPDSDWNIAGYEAYATGEVQMSDGNEYTVYIYANENGTDGIRWYTCQIDACP